MASGVLAFSLSLAACGQADNEPGPGGVTVGEARALDEAAEMLEQRRLPAEALRPPGTEQAPSPTQRPEPDQSN